MQQRFFQFGVRQFLLLFAVLSLLFAILAPQLQRVYLTRQLDNDARRRADTQANLGKAVRDNDVELARESLNAGANPNHILGDARAESLLRECIERGQIPMMALLLDFGADVERSARLQGALVANGPPLYAAISSSQPSDVRLQMIRLLVQHGADARWNDGSRNAMDVAVYLPDPQLADLLKEYGLAYGPREMAAFNRLEELQRTVKKNPDVLTQRFRPVYAARPGQEPTLLGTALRKGHREIALFLIESGAPLDTVEGLGQTLLHMAARGGNPELIHLLVTRGLDVNARDEYEDTPLTDCVWDAPPAAVSALIEAGAEVNASGGNKCTALLRAVRAAGQLPEQGKEFSERVEVIRRLLAAGADPGIADRDGVTALAWARENNATIATLLTDGRPLSEREQ